MAGILLVVLPTVMFGGISLLSLLVWNPAYAANPLRQDAHEPNGLIYLVYLGALAAGIGVITLGVGLLKAGDDR